MTSAQTGPVPRWVRLEGTANTRDVGGLPVEGGGRVRGGVLLRSDNLQDLTAADVALLVDDLGVDRVLDLRTRGEVVAAGPTPLDGAGVAHDVLPFIPDPDAAQHHDGRVLPDRTGTDPAEVYRGYLEDLPDNVVAAVRAVADDGGAVVVHCAAGKDRTGVLVALVLEAVGVPREAVVADYVATAEVIRPILARLAGVPMYADDIRDEDVARHTPVAATMRRFLERLDADGGAAGWLRAHGVTDAELARLRDRLVEPAAQPPR